MVKDAYRSHSTDDMRIYFLRHAQATHNAAAAMTGPAAYMDIAHRDAALTDTGREQAFNVNFGDTVFDAIYCSPLRRCRQTLLDAIPSASARRVCLDDRLMEPQGTHVCNWRSDAAVVAAESSPSWCLTRVGAGCPWNTETRQDFCKRIIHFTEDLDACDSAALVVAHYEWVRAWFALYAERDIHVGNAEYVWADVAKKGEGGAWTVVATSAK